MKYLYFLLILGFPIVGSAQKKDNYLSQDLRWRNIGPANMMGRIAAVEALPTDYRRVVMASASGGVFKSSNAGISWEPIFDRYGAGSIGSVSMHPKSPNIIWVGTGESANRNSSGWGDGIYLSKNGGKTFKNMGLKSTHHIAEIALHPRDTNIAYAAAVGHLWGYSGGRGLFKTTDAGKTWEKLRGGLPDDGKTGCTEVILDPRNPDIVFAGFYHRLREPHWYTSGGEAGGLFKSTDGGKSWKKLSKGLPEGHTGMIDLSICLSQPDLIAAAIEADENLPKGKPGSGVYLSEDGGDSWQFKFKHAVRPFYHGQIEIDPIDPNNIYIVSRDFRISRDGGKTFKRRSWRTDGGDDHDMWISPTDNNIMYLCTDQGLRLSVDGGKSFLSHNNMAVGQYYAIGIDMSDPYRVVGGLQDNSLWIGPSNSREYRGILNRHNTWLGEGDGFHAQIDKDDNNTAYIVNHVGFAARVDLSSREHNYITPNPENIRNFNDFFDPKFKETPISYTIDPGEYWFYYEFLDKPLLPPQFRFNWSSPLILSPHDQKTVYFAGNHVFKSKDQGNSWEIISEDLTRNDPEKRNPSKSGYLTRSVTGGENHFTIVSLAESPIKKGQLWAGSDDGLLHVSEDGGKTWKELSKKIFGKENKIWISRIEPSNHDPNRCYITLDNHRYDDMKPYVFMTEDLGKSWKDISSGLDPDNSLYVIREDRIDEDLLFVGSEVGVSFSYDRGEAWTPLMANMPTVAIHDLKIHPRDHDLVAGTHGRSIWIMDDISPLRDLDKKFLNKRISMASTRKATHWYQVYDGRTQPAFEFRGENPPNAAFVNFYLKEEPKDSVEIRVFEGNTKFHYLKKVEGKKGLNRFEWDFSLPFHTDSLENYKKRLEEVAKVLKAEVPGSYYAADSLKEISKSLKKVDSKNVNQLNQVRKRMVSNFGSFSNGNKLFPEKLFFPEAFEGSYRVEVRTGSLKTEGRIEVRNDPNL